MNMHMLHTMLQFDETAFSRPNSISITLSQPLCAAPTRRAALLQCCAGRRAHNSLQPLPKQPAVVRVFSPRHAPSSEPRR